MQVHINLKEGTGSKYHSHYYIILRNSKRISQLLLFRSGPAASLCSADIRHGQGGEGRVTKAENLRSPREIQSIFNLLGRTGKIIIFVIRVGI